MKRIFVLVFMGITLLGAAQVKNNENVVLTGTITGTEGNGSVIYCDSLQQFVSQEFNLTNERFKVEFKLKEPQVVMITFSDKKFRKYINNWTILPTQGCAIRFIAWPGMHLEINGDLKQDFLDIYPDGNKENNIFSKYTSTMYPIENVMANLELACEKDKSLSDETKQKYRNEIAAKSECIHKVKLDFLEKHVSSVGGLWLLSDMFLRDQITLEQVQYYLQKVEKKYANISYYKTLQQRIQGTKDAAAGKTAPNIKTKNTYDGIFFDLQDYRGKYVLLDFWGTWCMPCISGLPNIKQFGAKHADKLVVIGIAQDNEKSWREYLDRSEWDWKQILSGSGDQNFVLKYNVQGFPTKILIDPEGKILKRSVGEDPQFYKEVEQLMQ